MEKAPKPKKDKEFYIIYRADSKTAVAGSRYDKAYKALGLTDGEGYADIHWPASSWSYLKEIAKEGKDKGNGATEINISGIRAILMDSGPGGAIFLKAKDAERLENKSVATEYGNAKFVFKPMTAVKADQTADRATALGKKPETKAESLLNRFEEDDKKKLQIKQQILDLEKKQLELEDNNDHKEVEKLQVEITKLRQEIAKMNQEKRKTSEASPIQDLEKKLKDLQDKYYDLLLPYEELKDAKKNKQAKEMWTKIKDKIMKMQDEMKEIRTKLNALKEKESK